MKTFLCVVAIAFFADCEADCWPDVLELQANVSLASYRLNYDADEVLKARSDLRSKLYQCSDNVELYHFVPDVGLSGTSFSILSMAVIANDPELTKKFVERIDQSGEIAPEDLRYFGDYIALAAYFESADALEVLLNLGVGLSEASGGSVDYTLYVARVFTTDGLKIIRMLVEAGARVDGTFGSGGSISDYAASEGDLGKVQCLHALGAPLPPPTMVERRIAAESPLDSAESLNKMLEFLTSQDKEIPESVAHICSY